MLAAVLSAAIFGEPLTAVMGLGMVAIISGVLTVELGSQKAQQTAAQEAGVNS